MKKNDAEKNKRIRMFSVVTVLLAVVGLLMQILCEQLGDSSVLGKYLLSMLAAGGVFLLMNLATRGTHSRRLLLALLSWFVKVVILLWIFLLGLGIAILAEEENVYDNHLHKMATISLLELAKPFGKGDPCYEYPDPVLDGYEKGQEGLPQEVRQAFWERGQAAYYFRDYNGSRMLPVLSYSYGLWVNWLFVAMSVLWCVSGAVEWIRLHRLWEKLLYIIPYGVIGLQMVYALLGAFGKSETWLHYPFSGNWLNNVLIVAPMLGILFGLIRSSKPKPELVMLPGDDFWWEDLEENQQLEGEI